MRRVGATVWTFVGTVFEKCNAGRYVAIGACLVHTSCATRPENVESHYVSPTTYQTWSCDQLWDEKTRLTKEVERIAGLQRENANADAVITTVGVVVFFPVLLGLAATKDRKNELGGLKGEYDAVDLTIRGRQCTTPAPGAPSVALTPDNMPVAPTPNTQPPPTDKLSTASQPAPNGEFPKLSADLPRGPFDGEYEGAAEVLQTNVDPPIIHVRKFHVRVINGVGTGSVKHDLCDQPGEVFLLVDPSGRIKGKANTQNTTGCTERIAMLEGRMDSQNMQLSLKLRNNPQLFLRRTGDVGPGATPQRVADAVPPRGQFDGDYNGGVEIDSGNLRRVWLRIIGTKATGNVRFDLCKNVGTIAFNIVPDGTISGDADLLDGPSCASKKASIKGRLDGTQLHITFAYQDGGTSREFTFQRQHAGTGVD
jgi:hypothetical protein